MACGMLMLVAASTRTSTLTVLRPPRRENWPSCKTCKQLGLQRRRHLANFVQQQRALVAQLELARLGFVGTGKGARLVTEQFALQQLAGNRRAIDLQKRAVRAIGVLVNQLRQDFLACSALAEDQHREVKLCHLHRLCT